jgi:hypothetical protein
VGSIRSICCGSVLSRVSCGLYTRKKCLLFVFAFLAPSRSRSFLISRGNILTSLCLGQSYMTCSLP